ncbi:hypothetical protein FJU08_01310 [Martelella alba]|uniref:Uncharacterized protein n=1 Tax=Martelella alba TaxID=2590451 RepID=A0A506UIS5_9HYPH|nr:hypothetical protein [Martelella alba]TPW33231.1 hypothetical protein FJU08_01310 [Martelella alba]
MKLDIATLDVIEAAAAVAHSAVSQLYGMFNQTDGLDWTGSGLEGDALNAAIYDMGQYCTIRQAHGEQLWLKWLHGKKLTEDVPESGKFQDVETTRKWAYQLFAHLMLTTVAKFSAEKARVIETSARKRQKAAPTPALEDTIFEPVGNLDELEQSHVAFLKNIGRVTGPTSAPVPVPVQAPADPSVITPLTIGEKSDEKGPANGEPQEGGEDGKAAGAPQENGAVVEGNGVAAADANRPVGQHPDKQDAKAAGSRTVVTPPLVPKKKTSQQRGKTRRSRTAKLSGAPKSPRN